VATTRRIIDSTLIHLVRFGAKFYSEITLSCKWLIGKMKIGGVCGTISATGSSNPPPHS